MNAVHVMHMSSADPARLSRSVTLVDRQTRNLRRIVDDLLDVARVTRGKIELRKEPADAAQIVLQAVDVIRPQLGHPDELELDIPPGPPLRVDADRTRLEQSVVNLLLNAIKFSPKDRRIRVTIERVQQSVIVSIADNGIGIAPDMLTKIFGLFAQADRSLDRSQGGLGIGLFICKRLVELHGGTIAALSEGAGRGSVFKITLPLLHDLALEETKPAELIKAFPVRPGTNKKVLLVDDNVDSAITLSWLLGQHGYTVETAHDGVAGLKAAHEFRPDILLLDIGLPGISGYELAKRLRADGFTSALMVAISGYALEADIERSKAAGFDRHFAKPVDIDRLVESLETT
jgi:CheY-like chemotaxis protein